MIVNPRHPNVPVLYPLKNSKNLQLSDIFRVYRNGALTLIGLISMDLVMFMDLADIMLVFRYFLLQVTMCNGLHLLLSSRGNTGELCIMYYCIDQKLSVCNCKKLFMKNLMGQQNSIFNEKSELPTKLLRLQIDEMNSRQIKVDQ